MLRNEQDATDATDGHRAALLRERALRRALSLALDLEARGGGDQDERASWAVLARLALCYEPEADRQLELELKGARHGS